MHVSAYLSGAKVGPPGKRRGAMTREDGESKLVKPLATEPSSRPWPQQYRTHVVPLGK